METGTDNIRSDIKQSSRSKRRATIVWTLKLLVAIVLLYSVVTMVNLNELLASLESARPIFILLASLLLGFNLASRILKWKLMLKAAGNEATTWEAVGSILLGISLGSFTPGQLGELGGRYMRVLNGKAAHIVGLTVLDRAQVFLVLAMTGLTSYSFMLFSSWHVSFLLSCLCAMACLVIYFNLGIILSIVRRVPLSILRREWFTDFLESFGFLNKRQIVASFLYSVAFNGVLYLQMYFFLNAFGNVDLWTAFLGFSAMMFFKALLPISISDIGVREASTVYFFSVLGVSNVVALNASLVMFVLNMIIPSLLGVFFLPNARFAGRTAPIQSHG